MLTKIKVQEVGTEFAIQRHLLNLIGFYEQIYPDLDFESLKDLLLLQCKKQKEGYARRHIDNLCATYGKDLVMAQIEKDLKTSSSYEGLDLSKLA